MRALYIISAVQTLILIGYLLHTLTKPEKC